MDRLSDLKWHVTHMVRIWTVLDMIHHVCGNHILDVLKDVCADKLRIMLYELQTQNNQSVGFRKNFDNQQDKYKKHYERLIQVNKYYEGYKPKGYHARNISGAHLVPLELHFTSVQIFGFNPFEWKQLTKGVAACVAIMKILEHHVNDKWWREIREIIRHNKEQEMHMGIGTLSLLESIGNSQKIAQKKCDQKRIDNLKKAQPLDVNRTYTVKGDLLIWNDAFGFLAKTFKNWPDATEGVVWSIFSKKEIHSEWVQQNDMIYLETDQGFVSFNKKEITNAT